MTCTVSCLAYHPRRLVARSHTDIGLHGPLSLVRPPADQAQCGGFSKGVSHSGCRHAPARRLEAASRQAQREGHRRGFEFSPCESYRLASMRVGPNGRLLRSLSPTLDRSRRSFSPVALKPPSAPLCATAMQVLATSQRMLSNSRVASSAVRSDLDHISLNCSDAKTASSPSFPCSRRKRRTA